MSDEASIRDALRVRPDAVDLSACDTAATPHAPGKKAKTLEATQSMGPVLAGLQERLWAEGRRSVLLLLQGIDTAGKGGVVTHVVGMLGPEGVKITAFKKPTAEEAAHHFLWRIRKALPPRGVVGVFDRSHYEDVLVPRVHKTMPEEQWRRRYGEINAFEADLAAGGTTVVKCFLHVGYAEQRERLLARLDDPTKHWKFREADIDGSTEHAPWYVVPSDHKWYRNWAISQILREVFDELDPQYPQANLDVARLRERLQPPH